ncbi:hypothetical protein Aab01nite_03850 [Paractinoplanes abujensis]|nr:hypothetical protein Aab01nite_03850 [Actinoplanes abujensis]
MPAPARRRARRLTLFAVAALAVGAVVVARRRRSRVRGTPAPVTGPVRPAASGPERHLRRMAVGGALAVVLSILVVVLTRPGTDGGGRVAAPRLVSTPSPGPDGTYRIVTVPGPAARDQTVALTGVDGTRLHLAVKDITDPLTGYQQLGEQRHVMVTVHLHNTGRGQVGSRLDADAWVMDEHGVTHRANGMLSLSAGDAPSGSADPVVNPAWRLDPDWQVDRPIVFTVPAQARLTRLHITVPQGSAEWNL